MSIIVQQMVARSSGTQPNFEVVHAGESVNIYTNSSRSVDLFILQYITSVPSLAVTWGTSPTTIIKHQIKVLAVDGDPLQGAASDEPSRRTASLFWG
jgi:hypothetical protein